MNIKTIAALIILAMPVVSLAQEQIFTFDIPAQELESALRTFAKISRQQVAFEDKAVEGKKNIPVKGSFTAEDALQQLLSGSGLALRRGESGLFIIRSEVSYSSAQGQADVVRVAQAEEDTDRKEDEEDPERSGIPEVLVTGSKLGTLNADIRRTENDIQPYIVFDRDKIEKSGALNLEEFLKNELTVNVSARTSGQTELLGSRSLINLRGLGADETLILIDGRRAAGFNFEGTPSQPDINGIPLAAIERIEILPTTASGIFGGGATGGVINLVLRRDYAGFETQLTYGNSFESDMKSRRADLSAGLNLEGGKTNVLLSGSYSDANPLLAQERNFIQRGRQYILDRNSGDLQVLNQFGSPPLGATPNIRSTDGSDLLLDNGTALGSPITFIPEGYAGAATDGGAALLVNAGSYNLKLANTAQQGGGRYGLLGAPEMKSLMLTFRREFTPRLQAFLELKASESSTEFSANFANLTATIAGDAPNNPFQQSIRATVPTVGMDHAVVSEAEDRRAVVGVIAQLPWKWQAAVDFTWNRSRSSFEWAPELSPATSTAASSGVLDVLRDVNRFPVLWESRIPSSQSPGDMELRNTALRLGGALPWGLPGGNLALSSLVEHREESINDVVRVCGGCGGTASLYPARSQTVNSIYVEGRLPLASSINRRLGVELLELQVAVRGDEYRVTGANAPIALAAPIPIVRSTTKNSSVDPTVGLRYQPVPDLMLRASYGTGYLPPSMSQLAPEPSFPLNLGFARLRDPLRGNEPVGTVQWAQGGNSNLRPEQSESWSMGLIFTPRGVHGLRIAADWSWIEKIDNINFPFVFGAQAQKSLETLINFFPERITRGDPSDGFTVGSITGIDATQINIAQLQVEAVDLAFDYTLETERAGAFDISADATRLISLETQAAPGAEVIENLGVLRFSDGGLKWKANASLNWTYNAWNLGWRTRFFDSYFLNPAHTVDSRQGSASIPSQIFHDLYGGYRFSSSTASTLSLLSDTEVRFGINNVFNEKPVVDVVNNGILMYSYLGDPRLANYYVSIRKFFGR